MDGITLNGAGKDEVIQRLRLIAYGRANDAVKLVFLEPEQVKRIGSYDLTLLSEIKRGSNGTMEVKLINRLEALELLAKLLEPREGGTENHAESFFRAMDKAAEFAGADLGGDLDAL